MVPDRQKVRTDGRKGQTDGRTDDAKTISLGLRRGITILTPPRTDLSGAFCFQSEPNIPEGSEYDKKSTQYRCMCFESKWKMVWILIRWTRKKPADLDLQCFPKC